MPRNKFLDNNIQRLYRHNALSIMIYTWITAQKFTVPSISVEESSLAFMKHQNISEDEMSLGTVMTTFKRIQKEVFDEYKTR